MNTLANNPDYLFVGIYSDGGVSGTSTENRFGFQQMLDDCRNGKIDLIITKSVSRFARNTVDSLNAVRELKKLGVDVFFEKEGIHSLKSEGELLLTVMMSVAEAESFSISENSKWGRIKRIEQGSARTVGGKPFGYDRTENGLAINETQAPIVRRIFQDILDGYHYTEIAKRLNLAGYLTLRRNGPWRFSTIMQILCNEKYKGDCVYQKQFKPDPITKRLIRNDGYLPKLYLTATHEPLIEPWLWDCVQLEIKRRLTFEAEHHTSHAGLRSGPLIGKIICKSCGHVFSARGHSQYLFCDGFKKLRHTGDRSHLACHKIKISRSAPEQAFVAAWNELVNNRDRYADQLQQMQANENPLIRYRARDLVALIESIGVISEMPYELMIRVLDRIEVGLDSSFRVLFLGGVGILVRS